MSCSTMMAYVADESGFFLAGTFDGGAAAAVERSALVLVGRWLVRGAACVLSFAAIMALVGCAPPPRLTEGLVVGVWKVDRKATGREFLDTVGGRDGRIVFAADGTFVMDDMPLGVLLHLEQPAEESSRRTGIWELGDRGSVRVGVRQGESGVGFGFQLFAGGTTGNPRLWKWLDVDAATRFVLVKESAGS